MEHAEMLMTAADLVAGTMLSSSSGLWRKLTMLVTLQLLSLLCRGIRCTHGSTVHGNSSDVLSLVDFKKAIAGDPDGVLRSWNASTPFCQWKGVVCSWNHPGRVMALHLGGHGLSGSISPPRQPDLGQGTQPLLKHSLRQVASSRPSQQTWGPWSGQ